MYAVAFDLTVAETLAQHPKGIRQAYDDIGDVLGQHGFRRVQGSLYVTDNEDMAKLFVAIQTLKPSPGFQPRCATSGHSASSNGRTSRNW